MSRTVVWCVDRQSLDESREFEPFVLRTDLLYNTNLSSCDTKWTFIWQHVYHQLATCHLHLGAHFRCHQHLSTKTHTLRIWLLRTPTTYHDCSATPWPLASSFLTRAMDELAANTTIPPYRERPYYSRNIEFHQLAKCVPDFRAALKAASEDGFIDFQNEDFVQYASKLRRALTLH
jgi:hypothetical protein